MANRRGDERGYGDWFSQGLPGGGPPAGGAGENAPDDGARSEGPAGAGRAPVAPTGAPTGVVPGLGRPRRTRRREKNPDALRNDPERMMAGAYVKRTVRMRVDQALADPALAGDDGRKTSYSLLVESLLVKWLDEVGYGLDRL